MTSRLLQNNDFPVYQGLCGPLRVTSLAHKRARGTRTISIPIANHDNNQLWDGIELMAALLIL